MSRKSFVPPPEKTHELSEDGGLEPPLRILLLEDDSDFTVLLREYLEGQGFKVTGARNGTEGLKHIMAGEFDIILCDMIMPGLPGDMFYKAVERVRPQFCKRFIFMTGHKGDPKIDAFIRQVRGFMLWKPFELHHMLDAIGVIRKKTKP